MFDEFSGRKVLENGENSFTEFKEISVASEILTEEQIASLNSSGGSIYPGVSTHCEIVSIDYRHSSILSRKTLTAYFIKVIR
ncbi:hypothetical protein GKODMF_08810 [Candidatus Electrothrix gigas]